MVVAELGTTYDSDGGLYDWIREAFGDRWGSRVAWYYWINFPLWIASLATLFPDILGMVFGVEFELAPVLLIELAFVWIVVFMSFSKVSDSLGSSTEAPSSRCSSRCPWAASASGTP